MSKLLIGLLVVFSPIVAQAQDEPRRVMGNFIYKGQVYNFDFAQDDADSYSLFLSKLDVSKPRSQTTATRSTSATSAATSSTVTATAVSTTTATSGTPTTSTVSTTTAAAVSTTAPSTTTTAVSTATATSGTATTSGDSGTYFSEFSKSIFDKIFLGQMKEKFDLTDESVLREKSSEVFFKIKTRLEFIDDEPTTAYFILKNDKIYSLLKENPGGYYNGSLAKVIAHHTIHKVFIETEDGTIKNIKVNVIRPGRNTAENQSPRKFLEFKNQFPVSISGKFDPERFANVNLYCTNCNGIKGLSRFIKLADVIIFDIQFENEKEDYSPVNKVISLAPNNPISEVRKEKRSKILDVSAYTDFVGLNQDEPNGLIQFEVRRKVIINSTHRQIGTKNNQKGEKKAPPPSHAISSTAISTTSTSATGTSTTGTTATATSSTVTSTSANATASTSSSANYDSTVYTMEEFVGLFDLSEVDDLIPQKLTRSGNSVYCLIQPESGKTNKAIGLPDGVWITNNKFRPKNSVWFNNVEVKLQFLKLEENNRYIQSVVQDTQQPGVYTLRPIDLYKYQLTSVGPVLDIYKINYTQLKFSWNVLHFGVNWFSVRVADPTVTPPPSGPVKSIFVNNVMIQPGTSLTFRPDSRWGLTVGIAYLNQAIWSQQFDVDNKEGLLQYYLNGHHKLSENTRLFFRFRLTHEVKYRYQNFTQIQLGYNVDLFNMKRKLPTSN